MKKYDWVEHEYDKFEPIVNQALKELSGDYKNLKCELVVEKGEVVALRWSFDEVAQAKIDAMDKERRRLDGIRREQRRIAEEERRRKAREAEEWGEYRDREILDMVTTNIILRECGLSTF